MWQTYPKRSGSNPKGEAWKVIQARLKEGHFPRELVDGVTRYGAWCVAADKIGTEHVLQAVTFFGPSKRFLEPYDPPRRPATTQSAAADAAMARLTGLAAVQQPAAFPVFEGQARRVEDDDGFALEFDGSDQ